MGSSGSKTSTQESSPWAGQQPYLRDLFSQAQNLFNQGPQEYYPGETVAPFSQQTQQGLGLQEQRALGGSPQQDAMGNYLTGAMGQQNIDPSQIFNPLQQASRGIGAGQGMVGGASNAMQGMTGFGGLASAQQFAGNPALGALPASEQYAQNQMGVGGAGNQQLAQTAGGGFLGSNPFLDQMFDQASSRAGEAFNEQTMPAIAAQFGSAGRTGSGIHQQMAGNAQRQFGRDLQGMAADIYAPAYESERGRMVDAAGMGSQAGLGAAGLGGDLFSQFNQAQLGRGQLASGQYLGERGLGQQGAQNLGQLGLGQQQIGLGGLGQMGDMYGQISQDQYRAGTLAPSFRDMQYGDINQLMQAGGMREDQTQRFMDANQNRWNFNQGAPWQNLNNYANTIYGLPGGYGTQTSTQPGGSRLQGAAGGAAAGSVLGPWGAAAGGVLGAFM